jgi:hypothetical protein
MPIDFKIDIYNSMEGQDEFVHLLLGDSGTFIDIGSAHPFMGNNSATLEQLGWTGLAFDFEPFYSNLMNSSTRKTPCLDVDVTNEQPFIGILENKFPDKHINYISMDVDFVSVDCLKLLIDNGFTFDAMTYEHNFYVIGDKDRVRSRDILHTAGYKMLFESVTTCSENWSNGGPKCKPDCVHESPNNLEWEDWWIGPELFDNLKHHTKLKTYQECLTTLRSSKCQ